MISCWFYHIFLHDQSQVFSQYAAAGNNPEFPIGGLSLFFGGLSKINRDRLIANMPTSKIRSVAMGLVEINGKVAKFNRRTTQ